MAAMKESPKKAARRQELMSAIFEVVERLGYENLTIRDICRETGISIGTFYHYFEEKSDVVRILFKGIDDYFVSHVLPSLVDDEVENILIYVREYASYCHRSGVLVSREIATAPLRNAERNYLSDKQRQLSIIIRDIVRRGQEKGQITTQFSVEELSRMVLVGMRGYNADWAKQNGVYDIVEATVSHFKVFTKGIRA